MRDDIDFLDIFASLPGNIYFADKNGNFIHCNDEQARFFNFQKGEALIGKNIYELHHPSTGEAIRQTYEQVMATDQILEVEEVDVQPDGTKKYYLSKKVPLKTKSGEIIGVAGISLDITDRKRKEALEIELQAARSYAEGQRDMAVEIGKFSGGIGHELRTPVATGKMQFSTNGKYVVALVGLYRECAAEKRPGLFEFPERNQNALVKWPETFARIFQEMSTCIDDSLQALRSGLSPTLKPEDLQVCEMGKMLNDIVLHYPFEGKERDLVHRDGREDFKFMGNRLWFGRIINNLLKNALEEIKKKGRGEIFFTHRREERYDVLVMKDTAGGVSEEVVGKLFEGFYTTKEGGTGLGLAFCKRAMEMFGGKIEARVEEGCMVFLLSFPKMVDRGEG